jgi:adenosylcobinamide-GDP ribazoletransferase
VLVSLVAAFQFLTMIPPIVRRAFTPREMGQAVGFFPLVGLALGGTLLILDWGLGFLWPAAVSAALVLAVWVLLSGALHVDGFLDSCDGLWGGTTPESRLAIMRDERVGAFAVIGGILLLILKFAALASIATPWRWLALPLAPTLGRWGIALAVAGFPYARPQGLGRDMKDHAGWTQVALASGITLLAAWFIGHWLGLAAVGLAGLATWGVGQFASHRLNGLTGDIYGAICEITEVLILLFFAVRAW